MNNANTISCLVKRAMLAIGFAVGLVSGDQRKSHLILRWIVSSAIVSCLFYGVLYYTYMPEESSRPKWERDPVWFFLPTIFIAAVLFHIAAFVIVSRLSRKRTSE